MIKQLDLEKEDVLAFEIDGKIEEQDVKNTIESLEPELNDATNLNLYIEIPDYNGIEPDALWERVKFGFSNFSKIIKSVRKLAIVTDKNWISNLAKVYNLIPSIEHKVFNLDDKEKAKQWVTSS